MESNIIGNPKRCEDLSSPNINNFILSCLIIAGIVLSYLPQQWRIVALRSSEGISPYFVLLGTTSGTCAIANVLTLPISRQDMACCKINSTFSCIAGLLGIFQIGLQWASFFLIMLLFLIFVPRPTMEVKNGVVREIPPPPGSPTLQQAVAIVTVAVIHFFAILIITTVVLSRFPHHLQEWANLLGVLAAILGSIQYFPQIWTTWKLQRVGSLSVPMMCIQTPGGFIFAASLAARLGPAGWSAWIVYLVLATLQGVLLTMAVSFIIRDRRLARQAQVEDSSSNERARLNPQNHGNQQESHDQTERSPLLGRNGN